MEGDLRANGSANELVRLKKIISIIWVLFIGLKKKQTRNPQLFSIRKWGSQLKRLRITDLYAHFSIVLLVALGREDSGYIGDF